MERNTEYRSHHGSQQLLGHLPAKYTQMAEMDFERHTHGHTHKHKRPVMLLCGLKCGTIILIWFIPHCWHFLSHRHRLTSAVALILPP